MIENPALPSAAGDPSSFFRVVFSYCKDIEREKQNVKNKQNHRTFPTGQARIRAKLR